MNVLMRAHESGFTLIELIIVIVVLGLMGAILAPFIGPALTGSHRPIENLDHATDLNAEMAKVVAEYRSNPPENDPAMKDFQEDIPTLIDDTIVSISVNKRIMFERDGSEYVEGKCSPEDSLDCVLKVRLHSTANPGETLTYYFPYQR